MAKTTEVIIEDEENLEALMKEETVIAEPKQELVKVYPLRDSKSFMGGVWYILKPGKEVWVPLWVREQLLKDVKNPKIRW